MVAETIIEAFMKVIVHIFFKIQGEVPFATIWPQVVDAADMVIMTVGDEGGVKVI